MRQISGKRPTGAAAAKRQKVLKARLTLLGLLVLAAGGIWLLASALSQIKTVTELTVDASEYQVLAALPTQSEIDQAQREEEMKIENEIFEQKDSYPIDMIIQTPYCVMYDVQGRQVLYSKNAEEKAYPASTTKIMTASIMMEYTDKDTVFTAGDEQSLVQPGSSLAYLNVGSQLDREMMLDAIMLPSGNDASYCAAAVTGRMIAGDEALPAEEAVNVFVNKMNEKAKELGLKDTHFSNPHGLPAENHFTSAADLARLTDYALQNELFAEIVSTKKMAACEGARYYVNHNRLLFSYEGMIGVKTGYTQASGRCLVTAARRYGRTLICVTLNDYYCSADHVRMLDSGFSSTD